MADNEAKEIFLPHKKPQEHTRVLFEICCFPLLAVLMPVESSRLFQMKS